MSVSNRAIRLYNKLTELEIWVSGINNAGNREQRFFISMVVTKYLTYQSEAISWFFEMSVLE